MRLGARIMARFYENNLCFIVRKEIKMKHVFNECHFFTKDDKYFIFVVSNLRLYEVDKDSYEKIYGIYKHVIDADWDNDKEFEVELLEAEILKSEKDADATSQVVESKPMINTDNYKLNMSNIVLQVANDCNLNCKYCYGAGGTYNRVRELMTFETAKKAIDYFVANSGSRKLLYVIFFGGEPLLNFTLIKQVIHYCESMEEKIEKQFRYSMTTNGTILTDEIADYIKKYNITVMLSMDGPKEIQDAYRCYANGNGSYEVIEKNIERFKELRGGHLTVRSTICGPNIQMSSIRKALIDAGFTNVLMSLVDIDESSPLAITKNQKEELLRQYEILAKEFIEDIKNHKSPNNRLFLEILEKLYYKHSTIRSCSAGLYGFAIGSDGNVYPCQRFMGMEDYTVGNLDDGIDVMKIMSYSHANVEEKEDCRNCWIRYLCGGACMNMCVTRGGGIMETPRDACEIYRSLYEIILMIYYELKKWDENYFRNYLEEKTVESNPINIIS